MTKAFYLKGWHGINIEPLPNKFQKLMDFRKRDINLNIGISDKKGNLTLYIQGMGSTVKKKFSGNNAKEINIKVFKMSDICQKYIPKNEIIHFCKVDVEGNERNVLLGFDFEKYRPEVFCMESTIPGTNIPCHEEWEDLLLKNNYSFAYQYQINRFYIDNRRKYLRKRFVNVNNIIQFYEKIKNSKKKINLF